MTEESLAKVSGKLTILLWGLAVFVPALLAPLGDGVLELIDVNKKLGAVAHLVGDHDKLEDRFYEHVGRELGYEGIPRRLEEDTMRNRQLFSTSPANVDDEEG